MTARKILLGCGILNSLLYITSDIIASRLYEGYSYSAQAISELTAIGAPTRSILVPLMILYSLLALAFGWGVIRSARENRSIRLAGIFLIAEVIISQGWSFFPMHQRVAEKGFTDTMHVVVAILVVISLLLIIGFGSSANGKGFRIYSLLTILILLATGILMSRDVPKVDANLPTPWLGIKERINVYAYMVWVFVFALILLRKEKRRGLPGEEAGV